MLRDHEGPALWLEGMFVMQIDVIDTYVKTDRDEVLHFDVFVPCGNQGSAVDFTKDWLASIGLESAEVNMGSCCFCHSETANYEVQQHISEHGYFIFQMADCPNPVC